MESHKTGQSPQWGLQGRGTGLINDGIEELRRVRPVDVGYEVVKCSERARVCVSVGLGMRVGEGKKEWAVDRTLLMDVSPEGGEDMIC